jgi:hypothetical protein
MIRLADVENPSEANRLDEAAGVEGLDPETKSKTTPGANTISGGFPEKNSDTATSYASNDTSEDKHATKGFAGRVDGGQHAVADDEDRADESKGVEASEEK